ncbi:hypothetical protein ACDQ55_02855 [Chitinophaga sp. 30R24]|uniref:hypothetical protein n=1 Tax=Chitinophaga sp. 30R24 TaxID=3248838 RepID=UPI003B906779
MSIYCLPNTIHEFKSQFDLLYPRLCQFAHRMTPDSITAEVIVQEAFIAYWPNRHQHGDIENYLYFHVRSACGNCGEAVIKGRPIYNSAKAWKRVMAKLHTGIPWVKLVITLLTVVLAAILKWWYTTALLIPCRL